MGEQAGAGVVELGLFASEVGGAAAKGREGKLASLATAAKSGSKGLLKAMVELLVLSAAISLLEEASSAKLAAILAACSAKAAALC